MPSWPHDKFAPDDLKFRLIFGEANEVIGLRAESATSVLGMAWLYALHVRSSIARGRAWQTVHMISGVRERVVQPACLRHGPPTAWGRAADGVPPRLGTALDGTLLKSTEDAELRRCFAEGLRLLVAEARHADRKDRKDSSTCLPNSCGHAPLTAAGSPDGRLGPTRNNRYVRLKKVVLV